MTPALLALVLQAASPEASPSPPKARSHTVVGELVRVDGSRRQVAIREPGKQREYEIEVDAATRISSGGRIARLDELRAGDRVLAVCADDGPGRHRAVLLKVGPSRYAAPEPWPSPQP